MRTALLASTALHIALAAALSLDSAGDSGTNIRTDAAGPLSADELIRQTCSSEAPLLVVDNFSLRPPDFGVQNGTHSIDVDGDGTPDMNHGDIVASIAELSGKAVLAYGIPENIQTPSYYAEGALTSALEDIVQRMDDNTLAKPAGIILSISIMFTFQGLNSAINFDTTVIGTNIREHVQEVGSALKEAYEDNGDFYGLITAMTRIKAAGVPIYVAAGNTGTSWSVNILSLFGSVTVGATLFDGTGIAPYTTQTNLVTAWRTGDYIGRRITSDTGTYEGIDINNDGTADFPPETLSGGTPIAAIYNGLNIQNHFSLDPDPNDNHYISGRLPLYNERAVDDAMTTLFNETYGSATVKIESATDLPFRMDANGTLEFDPAGNGDPTQVSLLVGTSFAAPAICN